MYIAFYFFTLIHWLPSSVFFTIFLNVGKTVNIEFSSSWSFFNGHKYFVFVFSTASTASVMLKWFFCIIKLKFCAGSTISINKDDHTSTDVSTSMSYFPLTVAWSHFFDVSAITFCRCCVETPKLLTQGLTNCMHGYEHECNMCAKRFLCSWNYVHVNQSKHL